MSTEAAPSDDPGLIWARPAPGSRRPAYSRELIARTAIAIADAEGYEAVSMRRIAAELGAGTMTLYHYVRNKDELVALVADEIMSEVLIPDDELPDGWREGMAEIARRTLSIFKRHPWVVERMGEADPATMGPNMLHHVEQTLAVASRSGVKLEDRFELAAVVDDYVFGYAMRAYENAAFQGDAATRVDALVAYLREQLDSGEYPHLRAAAGDDVEAAFVGARSRATDEQRFERGLQRVLDGLQLWVDAST